MTLMLNLITKKNPYKWKKKNQTNSKLHMFKGLWRHYIALLCPLHIKRNLYHCSIQLWLLFIHFHNSWSIHCFSICTCRVHWIWFEHIFIWNKSTYTSEFIPEILFQTNFTRIKLKWFFFCTFWILISL